MAIAEGFIQAINFLLGSASSLQEAFYRIGVWTLLLAVFFTGSSRIFKERNISAVIAFILSALAIRLVPSQVLLLLGNVILIAAFIAVPYKIAEYLFPRQKLSRFLVLLVLYAGGFILFTGVSPDAGLINWLYWVALDIAGRYSVELTVLISLSVVYLTYAYAKKER